MKDSLLIVMCFAIGLLMSFYQFIPEFLIETDYSSYVLYILMFIVGIGVGSDTESLKVLKRVNFKILLIPLTVVVGSLAATALFSTLLSDISMKEAMAVGAGFGYYSLSSILINEMHSETLGTIALLANVIREIITLLFAPLMVMAFGKLAPVAAGGATAMDTTLPIIIKVSGNEYGLMAVFSGVVLTVLVPFLVTFILSF
ncbi:MAG: lysine exporter LysO family protein [Salinivirgaceae bacterium]|nr:lysine exporter LysO family protein [Salinivirgaceae bacterium]